MDQKILGAATVGCGNMGRRHHSAVYNNIEGCRLVATCDIIAERAQAVAEENGADFWTTDYKTLLNNPDIDVIAIATPNILHSTIAVDCLRAGKHVISDKPDAVSVEEVLKMQRAAEESGKVLMVIRNNRYATASAFAKKFITEGKMGDIYAARCGWQRRRGIPGRGGWFTNKALSGGGPVIDLGVHMIDLAIWLMGNPRPVAVSAATYSKFSGNTAEADSIHASFGEKKADGVFDVEDLAMGFIRFDNGTVMQLEFSWASNIESETRFVELRGTKAGLTWQDEKLKIFTEENGTLVNLEPVLGKNTFGNHESNTKHFIEVIQGKAKPDFIPQQGVDMIKILEGIYRSAAEKREIIL